MSVPFAISLPLDSRFFYYVPTSAHRLIFSMIYAVIGMLQPILTKTKETSDSISKVHAKLYFIFL